MIRRLLLGNGVTPYLFTITQSAGQTITVHCTHNGVTTDYTRSFVAYSRDTWTADVTPNEGYNAGTLNISSGMVMSDVSVYATSATLKSYTFAITNSTGGTISVTCGGNTYTSTFTAYHGQSWTASFTNATGYTGGTLNATSGTVSGAVTVNFSTAPALLRYTVTITGNATKNVRVTNASGTVITSGAQYDYGTVIYINGSLPPNTAQYAYSNLVCKYGGTTVTAESTKTLTGNVTIDVSCTATVRTYTFTITQSAGATITVACGGVNRTTTFTATYGQTWTASFSRATGYEGGTLSGTSGTVTGAVTVKFSTAPNVAYAKQMFTSSGTWKAPSYVSKVRYTIVGGGGGGAAAKNVSSEFDARGNAGGTSSAFNVSSTGGGGGYAEQWDGLDDNPGVNAATAGSAGSPAGHAGDARASVFPLPGSVNGGAGFSVNGVTYGSGGSASANNSGNKALYAAIAGGGSGGYRQSTVTVTPNQSYTITVGSGGTGKKTSYYNLTANNGTGGCVFIEWGKGI